jgi:hypothetical protein
MHAGTRHLLVWLLAFAGATASAQVVNIEGRRFLNDSVPWTGYANFRFNVAENGQRSMTLGLNGAIQYIDGRDRWFFINDLAFSQVEDNEFLNTGYQHLRYNLHHDSLWTGEAYAQAQYNKPLKLDLRLMVGAGPRLKALATNTVKVNVGTSLFLEREAITNGPVSLAVRNSTYISGTLNLTTQTSLTSVVYYQPKLFDASDQRVLLEAGLLIRVTSRFTLESRMNLLRDTTPPEGVNELNYSWNNMFGFRF